MSAPSRQRSAVVADDDPEIRDLVTEYLAGRGFTDEEEIRSILQDFLERQHYEAVLAEDGLAALQVIIGRPPPVVLLDISMARLGGIEALTAILAIAPHTKVIMISAIEHRGRPAGARPWRVRLREEARGLQVPAGHHRGRAQHGPDRVIGRRHPVAGRRACLGVVP